MTNARTTLALAALLAAAGTCSADTWTAIASTSTVAPVPNNSARFDTLQSPVINNLGEIAFIGRYSVGSTARFGVFRGTSTPGLRWVAYTGQPATGVPGATFGTYFRGVQLNDRGQVAFRAYLMGAGDGDRTTYLASDAGGLTKILREGDPAPLMGANHFYGDLATDPFLTSSGLIGFGTNLKGSGVLPGKDNALLMATATGALTKVVKSGDPAADATFPVGATWTTNWNPYFSMNSSGDVVASLSVRTSTQQVIAAVARIGRGSAPAVEVRNGDPAPGAPTPFTNLFQDAWVNDAGTILMRAGVENPGLITALNGFWQIDDGVGALAMLDGQPSIIPGVPYKLEFSSRLTEGGRFLVRNIVGQGLPNDPRALIAVDGSLNKTLLARTGNSVPGLPGYIYAFDTSFGSALWGTLNDAGQAVILSAARGPGGVMTTVLVAHDPVNGDRLLARTGTPFAGAPGAGNLQSVTYSTLNDAGRFAVLLTFPGSSMILRGQVGETSCDSTDFDGDGDEATDADIEAFFGVLGGGGCPTGTCGSTDFDNDGDEGTDLDIQAFFLALGGSC